MFSSFAQYFSFYLFIYFFFLQSVLMLYSVINLTKCAFFLLKVFGIYIVHVLAYKHYTRLWMHSTGSSSFCRDINSAAYVHIR